MEGSKHNIVAETCKAVAALAQHVRIDYDGTEAHLYLDNRADGLQASYLAQTPCVRP